MVFTVARIDRDVIVVDLALDPVAEGVTSSIDLDRFGIKFIDPNTIRMLIYSEKTGPRLGNKVWRRKER